MYSSSLSAISIYRLSALTQSREARDRETRLNAADKKKKKNKHINECTVEMPTRDLSRLLLSLGEACLCVHPLMLEDHDARAGQKLSAEYIALAF